MRAILLLIWVMAITSRRVSARAIRLLFFSCVVCGYLPATSQDSAWRHYDSLKDIRDVFSKKNKPKPAVDAVSAATELTYLPAAGYSLQTGFALVASANVAFRSGKGKDVKFSSITTSITYSQYHQTILPVLANVWSKNGKWNYSVDWRYMQYPSLTWGLAGKKDPNDNGYTIDFTYLKFHQMILRNIAKNLFVGTGFYYDNFWNIRELNANGQPLSNEETSNLRKQGLSSKNEIGSGIPFRVLYDSRLNQINPSQGWYVSATFRANRKRTGNAKNWQALVIDVRKYIKVTDSGNTLALWAYSWRSGKYTPYLLLPSTGWDDYYNTGRGYIQGRYRSNIMNYLEAEYRFRITNNGLLGAVLFSNVQSYKANLIAGRQQVAPAVGTGVRLKLNKTSGANLCIDYAVGKGGSQGFFVNLGEVF